MRSTLVSASRARAGRVADRVVQRLFMTSTVGLVAVMRLAFERDTARAPEVAERVLLRILRDNQDSVYGQRFRGGSGGAGWRG